MAIGILKAGVNSQDVTASTGTDVVDTVNYVYEYVGELPAAADVAKISEQEYRTLVAPAGLDDYTSYINALSDKKVFIPDGNWPFKGTITFLSDVKCAGVLVASGSGSDLPRVVIGNEYVQTTIDAATLSGLTRGSEKIIGLDNKKGQVLTIKSTEVASKRFGLTDEYVKEEVCVINSDNGDVWPPLMYTYTDTSLMTVTVCPMPPASKIDGLNIKGEYVGVDNDTLTISRHNITINSLRLIADDSQSALSYQGCHIAGCFDVTVNNPVIAGFRNIGASPTRLGYGINNRRSSFIKINSGVMYNNKHSIDALNSKSILINGGEYTATDAYPVGAHYADGLEVTGATLNCLANSAVGFSGGSVSVNNCDIRSCDIVIALRNDVPELFGIANIYQNEISFVGTSEQSFFGCNTISDNYALFFGRKIEWPRAINVTDNKYSTAGDLLRVTRLNTKNYSRSMIGGLTFENNKLLPLSTKSVSYLTTSVVANTVEFNISDYASSSVDPELVIKNNDSKNTLTVYIQSSNDTTATYKFSMTVENSGAMDYRVDVDSLKMFHQEKGVVNQIRTATVLTGGDTVRTETFFYELDNVKFKAATTLWKSTNRIIAKNSEFLGDVNLSTDSNNPQTIANTRNELFIYSNGNRAPAGADPARLPTLNDHFDATIWQ